MLAICSVPCQSQTIDRALFERMVAITKHFEGWHDPKTTPGYVGYGHQLQKGERFPKTLTRQRADLLLRTDLLRHLRLYARYGRDALLLSEISDNRSIGETILIIFVRKRKNARAKLQNTNNLLRNVPDWKGLRRKSENRLVK